MGLYLTVMSACLLWGNKIPMLSLALTGLTVGLPFLLWTMLRKFASMESENHLTSSLWLTGIYIFIFATLICGFCTAAYTVILQPGFITDYFNSALQQAKTSHLAAELQPQIDLLTTAAQQGMLPTPMQFTFTMMWATAFFGAILSLIEAIIINAGKRLSANPNSRKL